MRTINNVILSRLQDAGRVLQRQQEIKPFRKVKVVDVKEDTVTLDANHPLAGATLNFDVELIEID